MEALRQRQPDDVDAERLRCLGLGLLGDVRELRWERGEARRAWQAALTCVEPVARDSSDHRLLEPWARALLAVGPAPEAREVLARLRATGYRIPETEASGG